MTRKTDILKRLNKSLSPNKVDFSSIDAEVAALKKKLEETVNIQTVDDVSRQLKQFQNRMDFEPLIKAIDSIRGVVENQRKETRDLIDSKSQELLNINEENSSALANSLKAEISLLETKLSKIESSNALDSLSKQIEGLKAIQSKSDSTIVSLIENAGSYSKKSEIKKIVEDTQTTIEDLRTELIKRISTIGGGSINQKVSVNGTVMSKKYADMNFLGSITAADNNTTKQVDITFSGSGGSAAAPQYAVQFNNPLGTFAGDSRLTYNPSTNIFQVGTTPDGSGFGQTYNSFTSVGFDQTNPLVDTTTQYAPLLISPTLTQNTNQAGNYIFGVLIDYTVNGSGNFAGIQGNEIGSTYSGTGSLSDGVYGLQAFANIKSGTSLDLIGGLFQNSQSGGSVTNDLTLRVLGTDKTGGTTINATGLEIGDITSGSSSNKAINAGLGKVVFKDLAGTGTRIVSATSTGQLGAIATTGTGSVVLSDSPALTTNPTAPTQTFGDNSTKLATTAFVQAATLGQNFKEAVKYASTAALPTVIYANGSSGVGATITAVGFGAISLDGNTPSVNDRVLVKNQVSTFQNGIYTVTTVGTVAAVFVLTRSTDTNQSGEFKTGDSVFVTSGSTLSATTWAYTGIDNPTIGTDALTYVQVAGQGSFTAGNGITITGTSIAIDISITADKTTAQTFTNKRVTPRVVSATSYTTSTGTSLDFSTADFFVITAQAGALKFNNPGGSPSQGEKFEIRIKDNGTARALTWDTQWKGIGLALPSTTVLSKEMYIACRWNSTDTTMEVISIAQE